MQLRHWTAMIMIVMAVSLAAITIMLAGSAMVPAGSAPAATTHTVASPTAATPEAAFPPLYTPIPVHQARNVVGHVTIELTDRGFVPSRFENAINQEITFTLVNTGSRLHSFTIDELDVDVDVAPGETTTLTIPSPPRLKQYIYYSDTPEDRALGMTGIMTIFI